MAALHAGQILSMGTSSGYDPKMPTAIVQSVAGPVGGVYTVTVDAIDPTWVASNNEFYEVYATARFPLEAQRRVHQHRRRHGWMYAEDDGSGAARLGGVAGPGHVRC